MRAGATTVLWIFPEMQEQVKEHENGEKLGSLRVKCFIYKLHWNQFPTGFLKFFWKPFYKSRSPPIETLKTPSRNSSRAASNSWSAKFLSIISKSILPGRTSILAFIFKRFHRNFGFAVIFGMPEPGREKVWVDWQEGHPQQCTSFSYRQWKLLV